MKQPGGGTHNLKPGQLTDDSEMALALAYGLIEGKGNLDLNLNGKYYGMWRNSPPFDLGNTIGGTLGINILYIFKYYKSLYRNLQKNETLGRLECIENER